jgi:CheY-like chemotaxis protein
MNTFTPLEKPPHIKCVLLVDDNEIDSIIARKLMAVMNFTWQIVWVKSGLEAVEYLENKDRHPPDLILLDLHMPVCNGWQFLEIIGQRPELIHPGCRIYVLTSSTSRHEVEEILENPLVSDVFSKPFTVDIIRIIAANRQSAIQEQV